MTTPVKEWEIELMLYERANMTGFKQFGPLTKDQAEVEQSYLAWCEEREREYELEQKHGGRQRCPSCDQFTVKCSTVSTGYDNSTFRKCENCGWEEFSG